MTAIDLHHKKHATMLGNPVGNETTCPDAVGRYRHYERGSIHWHPDTGSFETHGAIRDYWAKLGWENSFLGYPVSDEKDYTTDDYIIGVMGDPYIDNYPKTIILGRCSFFQGGCIVWWSVPELQTSLKSVMLLLRPTGIGVWLPVEPELGFVSKIISVFSSATPTFNLGHVRLQDIPNNYGRAIWCKV